MRHVMEKLNSQEKGHFETIKFEDYDQNIDRLLNDFQSNNNIKIVVKK